MICLITLTVMWLSEARTPDGIAAGQRAKNSAAGEDTADRSSSEENAVADPMERPSGST